MSARRRSLGRGLDALLEKPKESATALPLGVLQPNAYQPRMDFDEAGLRELAESIRAQGIVQPIVVTPAGGDRYTIVAGERRFRAAGLAGLKEVPVVIRQVAGDQELLEMALVENLQRSDLNAMEEAEAYHALRDKFGLSQEQIAARVGKSRPTVANSLRLLKLPDEVQKLLRSGQLTAGQARPLLALDGAAQVEAARAIVAKGLSARQAEALVKRLQKPARPVPDKDVHTREAEETLTRALQTRVEIRRRSKGGSVSSTSTRKKSSSVSTSSS